MKLSDDWELMDNTPKWVWRLDEEFSRICGTNSPSDLRERAQEIQDRCHRAREDYFPDWPKDRFERWLAPRLEECRRVRNILTHPLDGTPAKVN